MYNEDAIHFHKMLKETCDRHDKRYYPDFKKWCDKYFFVEHRKETRGIGGIFFDDLDDKDPNEVFSFVKDACSAFLPCYLPIIMKRKVKSLQGHPDNRTHHTPKHRRIGNKYDGVVTLNLTSSSIEEHNSVSAPQALGSSQS